MMKKLIVVASAVDTGLTLWNRHTLSPPGQIHICYVTSRRCIIWLRLIFVTIDETAYMSCCFYKQKCNAILFNFNSKQLLVMFVFFYTKDIPSSIL